MSNDRSWKVFSARSRNRSVSLEERNLAVRVMRLMVSCFLSPFRDLASPQEDEEEEKEEEDEELAAHKNCRKKDCEAASPSAPSSSSSSMLHIDSISGPSSARDPACFTMAKIPFLILDPRKV